MSFGKQLGIGLLVSLAVVLFAFFMQSALV